MHVASLYISVIMFKYSAHETFLVACSGKKRARSSECNRDQLRSLQCLLQYRQTTIITLNLYTRTPCLRCTTNYPSAHAPQGNSDHASSRDTMYAIYDGMLGSPSSARNVTYDL